MARKISLEVIRPRKISLEVVRALKPGEIAWDAGKGAVSSFAARRQKGDAVAYVLKYRTKDGRQRWHTIGRHGSPWTPDMAREEARRLLGEVVDGGDPAGAKAEARKAATVAELCDTYFEAAEAGKLLTRRRAPKKASTLVTDKGRIERHIKPLLGWLKVASATGRDIERFQDAVTDGETAARIKTGKHGLARVTGGHGTATRTMGLLGAIFAFAVKRGLRVDNPVRGVERHATASGPDACRKPNTPPSARRSAACLSRLGRSLSRCRASSQFPGWRRGEALALTWPEVDLVTRTQRLKDTKTGASLRPLLTRGFCEALRALPRAWRTCVPLLYWSRQAGCAAFTRSGFASPSELNCPSGRDPAHAEAQLRVGRRRSPVQ